jgi:hypothetical protein
MSDITVSNDHEGFGPTELVQALRISNEALQSDVENLRTRLEGIKDGHQEQLDRMAKSARVRDSQKQLADVALRQLRAQAMRQMETIGDVDQASKEDGYYLRTVERAFQVGRVLGYTSECRNLAYELDLVELWDKVAGDSDFSIDDESDRYRKILVIMSEAQRYPDGDRHPMSAEYKTLWAEAYRAAKSVGLCDEYQRIAGYVGIPTDFELPWTATIRVYVEGWFEFEASGDAQSGEPDAYEELSGINLSDYVDELEFTPEISHVSYGE